MRTTGQDKTIEEIRQGRYRISEECGHDPERLLTYLKGVEGRYTGQVLKYRHTHRRVRRKLVPA